MRNVKWNFFKISVGTTVGFPSSASVLYGNGGLGAPFVAPLVCLLVSWLMPLTPLVALPLVPTPRFGIPPSDGAIEASLECGGER